jgi:flagellar hook-associated protein 2
MSAVTFSGTNGIDFTMILNAVMTQERVPLDTLTAQQSKLKTQSTAFASLASKLASLGSAGEALTKASAFGGRTVSTTDASILSATGSTDSATGIYDVTVHELARGQVTASSSRHANTNQDVVATGGTMTIGGQTVTLSGDVTLQGLADAINGTADIPVTASIVNSTTGYQLVLTGRSTGQANAFTIANQLTGSTLTFTDTDADGISGDSAADNAMQASNARVTINNVEVTSDTNTIENAIPGTSLSLLRQKPDTTVTVSVAGSTNETTALLEAFVAAYNSLMTFANQQNTATGIGRDSLFRSLRGELRTALSGSYAAGGDLASAGQAGVEFDRTGTLTINRTRLQEALSSSPGSIRALFMGDGVNPGVFSSLKSTIARYTDAGALLSSARDRIDDQISAMGSRLAAMEERLANRRAALQKEYIAADMLIGQLNSQAGSLSSLGNQYSLF